MKNRRLLAAIAALALCVATVVWGQTFGNWGQKNQPTQSATSPQVPAVRVHVVGGVDPADTSFVPFQFSSGALKTREQSPLASQSSGWIPIAGGSSGDTTSVGTADSCQIVSIYPGYILHGLAIRASLPASVPSATNAFVRVAIQIRTHVNGLTDSLNTTPVFVRLLATDSTTTFGKATQESPIQQGDDEFVVTLVRQSQNGGRFCAEFARYIQFEYAGPGIRLPNFSVRWRVLSANANTNSFYINAYATVLR